MKSYAIYKTREISDVKDLVDKDGFHCTIGVEIQEKGEQGKTTIYRWCMRVHDLGGKPYVDFSKTHLKDSLRKKYIEELSYEL